MSGFSFSLYSQTMGLMQHDAGTEDGYVLFAPISSTATYLMDKCGKEVHSWSSTYRPGQSVYLLADGNLLRTGNAGNPIFTSGGTGGVIEEIDWSSSILWSYTISDTSQCQHHDVCYLPGGNILAIVWEKKSVADAIAIGRNPSLLGTSLWSEKLVELQPTGTGGATIVWEWHAWDHLNQDFSSALPGYDTISKHPELIDINYYSGMPTTSDWLHINAVAYNAGLDQVMVSVHNFSEIWVIDHSTTTAEAAGHTGGTHGRGGDLLYRWGNPEAYDLGTAADRKLFGQHNAQWIANGLTDSGKIIVFNNGQGRPGGNYSTIDIIDPPVDGSGNYSFTPGAAYAPATAAWSYQASTPTDFFAPNISGVQRLANGNTLVCAGPTGVFFEINASKEMVWRYTNPVNAAGPMTQGATPTQNAVFRCSQYDASYTGFSGHTLTPGVPIEINPLPYSCGTTGVPDVAQNTEIVVVNPFRDVISVKPGVAMPAAQIRLMDITGKLVAHWDGVDMSSGSYVSLPVNAQLPKGVYVLALSATGYSGHFRLLKE